MNPGNVRQSFDEFFKISALHEPLFLGLKAYSAGNIYNKGSVWFGSWYKTIKKEVLAAILIKKTKLS